MMYGVHMYVGSAVSYARTRGEFYILLTRTSTKYRSQEGVIQRDRRLRVYFPWDEMHSAKPIKEMVITTDHNCAVVI